MLDAEKRKSLVRNYDAIEKTKLRRILSIGILVFLWWFWFGARSLSVKELSLLLVFIYLVYKESKREGYFEGYEDAYSDSCAPDPVMTSSKLPKE